MENTLVWELLARLGDDAARALVTRVHDARIRGNTPSAVSGDLPIFFLQEGRDVREAVDSFCESAARVAANEPTDLQR